MLEIYLFTLICSQLSSQLKYFRKGWDRKEGRGHKNFEKGGKQGQGVGALVGWNPPYKLCLTNFKMCSPLSAVERGGRDGWIKHPTKFSKTEGLTRSQFLEGVTLFQGEL